MEGAGGMEIDHALQTQKHEFFEKIDTICLPATACAEDHVRIKGERRIIEPGSKSGVRLPPSVAGRFDSHEPVGHFRVS